MENYLMHHGIKNQKWGVRRYQNKDGSYTTEGKARRRVGFGKSELTKSSRTIITSKGERVNLEPVKVGKLSQFLQNHSRRFREMNEQESSITITNSAGKKVGNLFLEKRGDDELNINWIGISNKERGKGYASAVLRDTVRYAKENGFKKVTLEVPGHSPDARHIYEKVGFKVTKIISDDDVWDGLTAMELNLDELEHSDYLMHHGIKGQKWGVRRYQNEDGSRTKAGKLRRKKRAVFISGSSKTETRGSPYYREDLPDEVKRVLDKCMDEKVKVIVGDAPGIDRQVQRYLNDAGYRKVHVYGPGKKVRYSANSKWKTHPIDDPDHEPGSKEWLSKKDIAMERAATEGLAVILDEGSSATRKNIERLSSNGKSTMVYQLNRDGKDAWNKDLEKHR